MFMQTNPFWSNPPKTPFSSKNYAFNGGVKEKGEA